MAFCFAFLNIKCRNIFGDSDLVQDSDQTNSANGVRIWETQNTCLPEKYSRLSLSRIPRDSLKHFEISVPRHIRVEGVRKTIN